MTDITIAPHNHAYCSVWASEAIERELSDEFSFVVPGHDYMQKYRRQHWDGRIRMFNRVTKHIYTGLVPRILSWAKKQGYTVENKLTPVQVEWSDFHTQSLLNQHPVAFDVRDYQREAITYGMSRERCVLLSPTASGKSLILYYLVRARIAHGPILLIVPTISLVNQMVEDWRGYGWTNVDQFVHQIRGGRPKDTQKPIVVSTWQSIFKQPEAWFDRYTSIFGDECHLYKAESLRGIMEKLPRCGFRIGVTGTLDDAKSSKLMVEGVFGLSHRVAKTADLQTQGHLVPIQVQAHFLEYPDEDRYLLAEQRRRYADELDFVVQHSGRMDWMTKFIPQLPGNVLVLYQFVEKHGIPLYHALKTAVKGTRPVYFISGGVDADSRERIRALLEQPEHVVLTFGEQTVRCLKTEEIPLTTGGTKLAEDITPSDDVADEWILNRVDGDTPHIISEKDTQYVTENVGQQRYRQQQSDLGD